MGRRWSTMRNVKCEDYVIFKICYYADAYLKRKCKDTSENRKEHRNRAETYNIFKWKFIEKVTGLSNNYFYDNYRFNAQECAFEQMQDDYGIIVELHRSGWYTYYIPKHMTEVIEWIKTNLPYNPYKIVTKTFLPMILTHKELKWKREDYKIIKLPI